MTATRRSGTSGLIALPAGLLAGLLAIAGTELGPVVALAALGAGAVMVAAFLRPMWVLYAALAAIPLETAATPLGTLVITPTEVLFAASAMGWIARRVAEADLSIRPTSLTAPLALLVVSLVPGLLVAVAPGSVARQLIIWVLLFAIFLMITTDGEEKDLRRIAVTIALVGGVVGVIAVFAPAEGGRASGPFVQANTLGQFIVMAIPLQVAFAISGRGILRFAMTAAALLGTLGLMLSASRGALIGLIAMFLIFLAWRPFRYLALVAGLTLLGMVAIQFEPVTRLAHIGDFKDRVLMIGRSSDPATVQRVIAYERTPEMIADHPLFGVGAYNYRFAAPEYGLNFPAFTGEFGQAHNTPLAIASERGLIGLAALVWVVVAMVKLLAGLLRRAPPKWRPIAFGFAGVFAAQALVSQFEYGLPANPLVLTTFALLGCTCLLDRLIANEEGDGAREKPREALHPGRVHHPEPAPA